MKRVCQIAIGLLLVLSAVSSSVAAIESNYTNSIGFLLEFIRVLAIHGLIVGLLCGAGCGGE
jgi:uncharacterized Tic20 family protein